MFLLLRFLINEKMKKYFFHSELHTHDEPGCVLDKDESFHNLPLPDRVQNF